VNDQIESALQHDRLTDITTIGRKTGEARRMEIGLQRLNGELYLMGLPEKRGWSANLVANLEFTFHLKQSAQQNIPAVAEPVRDRAEKRRIYEATMAIPGWEARQPEMED
jgi:hypothetical protein